MISDKEEYCRNCGAYMELENGYCMFCGAERREGEFRPEDNVETTVYGPPMKSEFVCKSCGHTWNSVGFGRSKVQFCPMCGKPAPKMLSHRFFGEMFGAIAPSENNDK